MDNTDNTKTVERRLDELAALLAVTKDEKIKAQILELAKQLPIEKPTDS